MVFTFREMTKHEHAAETVLRVLAIYMVTKRPSKPLIMPNGERIETVTVLCKQACMSCGCIFLGRLPFIADSYSV